MNSLLLPSLKFGGIRQVNIPPNNGNIAFSSINNLGTKGELNSFILKEYGYSEKDLPKSADLIDGIAYLQKNDLKPIIFVVTVNHQETSFNLEQNLYNAIISYKDKLIDKEIWLPLMGTGVGNLSIEESYLITVNVINRFKEELNGTNILLSYPDSEEGVQFFNKIVFANFLDDIQSSIKNSVQNSQNSFYLIEEDSQNSDLDKSYKTGIWERKLYSSNGDEYKTVSKINNGDIFIVKSTRVAPNRRLFIEIKAVGKVKEVLDDKRIFKIHWLKNKLTINIHNLDFFYSDLFIQELSKTNVVKLLSMLNEVNSNLVMLILASSRVEKIAGLISDSDNGDDYLEIQKDINAFAKVIAAKNFEPPLAIALFGKWGSGKSFFMKKLKK